MVGYDNASSSSGTGVSSLTWAHTVGTGNHRLLIVGVSVPAEGSAITVTGITYAGLALTLAVSKMYSYTVITTQYNDAEIWYLVNPPSGSANIVVTLSGSASYVVAGAVSYTGVDQTTPIPTTASNDGTGSPAISITTANANSWIVDTLSYSNTTSVSPSPNSGQTQRWGLGLVSNTIWGCGSDETTTAAGSYSMGWTVDGAASPYWAYVCVEIKGYVYVAQLVENLSALEEIFVRSTRFRRMFVEKLPIKDVFSYLKVRFHVFAFVEAIFIQDVVRRKTSYKRKLVDYAVIRDAFKRSVGRPRKLTENLSVIKDVVKSRIPTKIRKWIENLVVPTP